MFLKSRYIIRVSYYVIYFIIIRSIEFIIIKPLNELSSRIQFSCSSTCASYTHNGIQLLSLKQYFFSERIEIQGTKHVFQWLSNLVPFLRQWIKKNLNLLFYIELVNIMRVQSKHPFIHEVYMLNNFVFRIHFVI